MKIHNMDLDERQVVCNAINQFGTGEHPVAEINNLAYFQDEYITECLVYMAAFLQQAILNLGRDIA